MLWTHASSIQNEPNPGIIGQPDLNNKNQPQFQSMVVRPPNAVITITRQNFPNNVLQEKLDQKGAEKFAKEFTKDLEKAAEDAHNNNPNNTL